MSKTVPFNGQLLKSNTFKMYWPESRFVKSSSLEENPLGPVQLKV